MALINGSDLSVLKPAKEVIQVSLYAPQHHLECAVARAINGAANVGERSVVWNQKLNTEIIDKLEANGYTVINNKDAYSRDIPNMYTITW